MTTDDPVHPDLYADADPRVYSTRPGDPESGQTFVWAATRWFERVEGIEGEAGAVAFAPIAESDEALRDWLSERGLEMDEVDDDEFAPMVREEFLNQTPLYPGDESLDQGLGQAGDR